MRDAAPCALLGSRHTLADPGLAESIDVVWAPVSSFALLQLFGRNAAVAGFVEELLPGTDVIPTATIYWILEQRNRNADRQRPHPPPQDKRF